MLYFNSARHRSRAILDGTKDSQLCLLSLGSCSLCSLLLSIRQDILPAAYAAGLQELQDNVPPFSAAQGRSVIERELGTVRYVYPADGATGSSCTGSVVGYVWKYVTNDDGFSETQRTIVGVVPVVMETVILVIVRIVTTQTASTCCDSFCSSYLEWVLTRTRMAVWHSQKPMTRWC